MNCRRESCEQLLNQHYVAVNQAKCMNQLKNISTAVVIHDIEYKRLDKSASMPPRPVSFRANLSKTCPTR